VQNCSIGPSATAPSTVAIEFFNITQDLSIRTDATTATEGGLITPAQFPLTSVLQIVNVVLKGDLQRRPGEVRQAPNEQCVLL
jgi:hypothetical protein